MGRPKVGRTVRAKRASKMLQERDGEVLLFLAVARFAEPRHVASAIDIPSLDRARRVLRRLYDAGCITVTMTASTSPNLVSLSREGLDLVRQSAPELAARVRLTGIRLSEIERHILLLDARLFAAAIGEARGGALLRFSTSPASVAKDLGMPGLVPDALATFSHSGGTSAVAVEADIRTSAAASLLRRLDQYRSATSRLDALWIATAGDAARVRVLEARLVELGLGFWARVVQREVLVHRPASLPPHPDARSQSQRRAGPAAAPAASHVADRVGDG